MDAPVFYAPPENISDRLITLPRDEVRHADTVLRLPPGSLIWVVDGLGMAYRCELRRAPIAGRLQARVVSETRNFGEPAVRLTLAAGMSSGYKFDAVVDGGTQLGVSRFVPLLCEKGKVKESDPARVYRRTARLEKVALAAMKQARRSVRPEIASPIHLARYLSEVDPGALNIAFQPGPGGRTVEELVADRYLPRVTVLVGPESGFSDREAVSILESGFEAVSLGRRILRTELAAPVGCALIMHLLGELR